MMGELAQTIYAGLAQKLEDVEKIPGFRDGEWLQNYRAAARAVADFVMARPAMLIADASDKEKIMGFLRAEKQEAEEAIEQNGPEQMKIFEELGDVGFFGLLLAMIHGENLTPSEEQELQATWQFAEEKSIPYDLDLAIAVAYVAGQKDVINYPEEFYLIWEEDEAEQMSARVKQTAKDLRMLRPYLNGEWIDARENLLPILVEHWVAAGGVGPEAELIMQLFVSAGLKMYEQLEVDS